ncbi:MAG TPA: sugar nucleotide-binding protein [Azospirillaceae bacterium]|nr:sugar nucleotide-binding protein [Azospirillaceae bacterium]
MDILVTGLGGTLGPKVAAEAARRGHGVVGWDRRAVPPEDAAAVDRFLAGCGPVGAVVHLALGPEAWAGRLAGFAAARGLPFVHTGTAMVFHHLPDGPHRPEDPRTAEDDYGRYKIRCEDAVRAANPDAMVARIGWQIDGDARGNNMLAHLDDWQRRDGRVAASRLWTPACSFMEDTAAALLELVERPEPGLHHFDSNAHEAHRFDAVARALAAAFGRTDWRVEPTEEYRHDQRLVGGTRTLPPLSARLAMLR